MKRGDWIGNNFKRGGYLVKRIRVGAIRFWLFLFIALFCSAGTVQAEIEIQLLSEVLDKFTIGGEINVFYRFDEKPFYGADITPEEGPDTDFGETFSRIRFTAEKKLEWATLEGQFAPYYAETIGQDVYGLVKDDQKTGIDQAWLKFNDILGSPIDVTVGRQDIKIEKWFLVADGEDQEVANWLYFHSSFPFAVKLDGEFNQLKSTWFWARSGSYVKYWTDGPEDDIDLTGLNLHYDFSEKFYIYGGMYYKNEDRNDTPTENDTWAFDIGADATFGGLQLEGEFVYETGDVSDSFGEEKDRNAFAGFASATYTFPVKYAPYLRGTYLYFTGDDDPNDDDVEEYDPMFFDFKIWNRWVIGELVGETQLPNYNKQNFIAEVGFSPVEPMVVSLMYIRHELAESNWLGMPLGSDEWADEINLLIDYPIGDHLFVHTGLGYVTPGDAAEEVFGDDENAFFAHLWLNFYF